MSKTLFLISLLVLLTISFIEKTEEGLKKSFKTYDADNDGYLHIKEAQKYYKDDFMKEFKGIQIDPKFIDQGLRGIRALDSDGDQLINVEDFVKNLMPDKDRLFKKYEPNYYPQEEL